MGVSGVTSKFSINTPQNIEQINAMKQSAPRSGGFNIANAGDIVHGEFEAANGKFASSLGTSVSSCKNLLSSTKSTTGDCNSSSDASHDAMGGYTDGLKEHKSIVEREQRLVGKSQQASISISEKQQGVKAWIENTNPQVEALQNQITELENTAISQIAELCPNLEIAEGTPLEEIAAMIGEAMEPMQEELEAKQAEKETLEQERDSLDPNDPKDQQKLQSLEGQIAALGADIQSIMEDGGFAGMSESMAIIQDTVAAVSECQTAILNYAEQLEAKSAESDSLAADGVEEANKTAKGQNNVKKESQTIDDTEKDGDDENSQIVDILEKGANFCNKATTVGSIANTTGQAMCATGYGTAVGSALIVVGTDLQIYGGVGEAACDLGLLAATGDMNYLAAAGMAAGTALLAAASSVKAGKDAAKAATAASEAAQKAAENAVKEGLEEAAVKAAQETAKAAAEKAAEIGSKVASTSLLNAGGFAAAAAGKAGSTVAALTSVGNSLQSIGGGVQSLSGKKYEDGRITSGIGSTQAENKEKEKKSHKETKTTTTKTASGNTVKFGSKTAKNKETKKSGTGDDVNTKQNTKKAEEEKKKKEQEKIAATQNA